MHEILLLVGSYLTKTLKHPSVTIILYVVSKFITGSNEKLDIILMSTETGKS